MEARSTHDHTLPPRRKRLLWAVPVVLTLAFAGYHIWDLTLWNGRTGLALPIVDIESANRTIEENDQATVLDIRLHGAPSPARRTLRMPSMELVRRIDELEPYRDAPLFVLAATDAEAAATAAFLARRDFNQVACIRIDPPTTAHARADTSPAPVD